MRIPISRVRCDRIGDDAVNSDDAEQQSHASRNAQHDQGKRGARHRLGVEIGERVNIGERQIWIGRPHHLLDFLPEGFRASPRTANGESDIAVDHFLLTFETVHRQGPVHRGWRRLAHAFVVQISGHADNLAPVVCIADADLFAQRAGCVAPVLSRKILGDDRDGDFLVDVRPGQVAADH
jgi:hypothetical protein